MVNLSRKIVLQRPGVVLCWATSTSGKENQRKYSWSAVKSGLRMEVANIKARDYGREDVVSVCFSARAV